MPGSNLGIPIDSRSRNNPSCSLTMRFLPFLRCRKRRSAEFACCGSSSADRKSQKKETVERRSRHGVPTYQPPKWLGTDNQACTLFALAAFDPGCRESLIEPQGGRASVVATRRSGSSSCASSNPRVLRWGCSCGRCRFGAPPPLPGPVRAPGRQECIAEARPRTFLAWSPSGEDRRLELLPRRRATPIIQRIQPIKQRHAS
jgi:hypothetical protein